MAFHEGFGDFFEKKMGPASPAANVDRSRPAGAPAEVAAPHLRWRRPPLGAAPLSVASTEATRRPSVAATEATCTAQHGTGTGRAVRGKSGGTAGPDSHTETHTQDRYTALRGDNLEFERWQTTPK